MLGTRGLRLMRQARAAGQEGQRLGGHARHAVDSQIVRQIFPGSSVTTSERPHQYQEPRLRCFRFGHFRPDDRPIAGAYRIKYESHPDQR